MNDHVCHPPSTSRPPLRSSAGSEAPGRGRACPWKPLEGACDSPLRPRRTPGRSPVWLLASLLILPLACAPPPEPPPEGTPRLVLSLVVDQGRADYLERLEPFLSEDGGFRWLLEHGVSFTEAHHDHAVTNTAPGHATLATGTVPARSGIVDNVWVDRESGESVYCVEDERWGISPANLLTPTLGDRLEERYPGAKVFTASGKDRGATLLAGQRADGAFWYDRATGDFTSSGFWGEDPAWVEELNDGDLPEAYFGTLWRPLDDVETLKARVGEEAWLRAAIQELDSDLLDLGFPHALGGLSLSPGPSFYYDIYDSPFVDELVARFGETVLVEEGLGRDEVPDYLGLSFSALDTVGHDYGPNSPEMLDVVRRLDVLLGQLLETVDRQVGLQHVVVTFSSDHGVAPLPEVQRLRGEPGRRAGWREVECLQGAGRKLAEELGVDPWLARGMYLDPELLNPEQPDSEQPVIDPERVLERAAELVAGCPLVERVWTATELEAPLEAGEVLSDAERRFRASHHPERSPDLHVQLGAYHVAYRGLLAVHGSVYRYDSHVPFIVAVPGRPAGRVGEPVRTVDLTPTLAELLDVEIPPGEVDGRSLVGMLDGAEFRRLSQDCQGRHPTPPGHECPG